MCSGFFVPELKGKRNLFAFLRTGTEGEAQCVRMSSYGNREENAMCSDFFVPELREKRNVFGFLRTGNEGENHDLLYGRVTLHWINRNFICTSLTSVLT